MKRPFFFDDEIHDSRFGRKLQRRTIRDLKELARERPESELNTPEYRRWFANRQRRVFGGCRLI